MMNKIIVRSLFILLFVSILFVNILLSNIFVNSASAETFSAEFVETCIGCLDDVAPQADPVINAISLPAGRIKLTIDTKVAPYRGMGSVSCVHGFFYSDLSADLKAWPNSYTGIVQGNIIESDISPCSEGGEHREHYVTILKLKEPVENFKISIVPSITYNNLGPKYQYGQKKVISISWEGAGDCSITGQYAWFNGNTVYIRPDGTIESWVKNTKEWYGTWTRSGDKYTLNWRNDVGDSGVDTIVFSDDCKSVYGSASAGFSVGGTKTSDIDGKDGSNIGTGGVTTIPTTVKSTITPGGNDKTAGGGTIDITPKETVVVIPKLISDTWNKATVYNNPFCKPNFTISESQMITYVDTYHWNYGSGTSVGGTISLKKNDGTIYGPWKVETKPGMNNVPNAWWIARPNETIPAGTYTIEDSDVATWSYNQGSNGCGFSKIEGYAYKQVTTLDGLSTPKKTNVVQDTRLPTPTNVVVDGLPTPKKTNVVQDTRLPTPTNVVVDGLPTPKKTDAPNIGIVAVISMIIVVFVLLRNIKNRK